MPEVLLHRHSGDVGPNILVVVGVSSHPLIWVGKEVFGYALPDFLRQILVDFVTYNLLILDLLQVDLLQFSHIVNVEASVFDGFTFKLSVNWRVFTDRVD